MRGERENERRFRVLLAKVLIFCQGGFDREKMLQKLSFQNNILLLIMCTAKRKLSFIVTFLLMSAEKKGKCTQIRI